MAKREILTPRFYADIPTFMKTQGHFKSITSSGLGSYNTLDNPVVSRVYNMNPYQPSILDVDESMSWSWINIDFYTTMESFSSPALSNHPDYGDKYYENYKLLSFLTPEIVEGEHHTCGAYAGVVAHNFVTRNVNGMLQGYYGRDDDYVGGGGAAPTGTNVYASQQTAREIINCTPHPNHSNGRWMKPDYDGFSLWEITSRGNLDNPSAYSRGNIRCSPDVTSGETFSEGELMMGSQTWGIFFEPEHAFDIRATVAHSYDGIKNTNTVGGSTITNINYMGVPNWGDLPAWTLRKTSGNIWGETPGSEYRNYDSVTNRARRQWQVGLSFLSDDNVFDNAGEANKFSAIQYNDDGTEKAHHRDHFDQSMSSFFKLTMNGQLPFIFSPNSKADKDDLEFALCRITNKPVFKQVANNLFSTSLTITETW